MNKTLNALITIVALGACLFGGSFILIESKEYFESLECLPFLEKTGIKVVGFIALIISGAVYFYYKHPLLLVPPFIFVMVVILSMFAPRCF